MEYRIIQKYFRETTTAKIKHYFIIEYLCRRTFSFLFSKKFIWKPYKIIRDYGMDSAKEIVKFDTEKEARIYLKNLQKRVYSYRVVFKG